MPPIADPDRPAPRKRPRQARSADTVAVIVEGAARILEAEGLAGFTTNRVAERAGVSIGSLYQYFPSKAALIGALIVRETGMLIAEWEAASAEGEARVALAGLIDAAVAHQLRRPVLARLLDREEARLPFDRATQAVAARLHAILADLLARNGEGAPELAAHDVLAIIRGMVDGAGERGEDDPVALAARVRRAVFGYLTPVA